MTREEAAEALALLDRLEHLIEGEVDDETFSRFEKIRETLECRLLAIEHALSGLYTTFSKPKKKRRA